MIKTKDRHKATKTQIEAKSKQKIDTKAQRLKEKQKASNILIEKTLRLRVFGSAFCSKWSKLKIRWNGNKEGIITLKR